MRRRGGFAERRAAHPLLAVTWLGLGSRGCVENAGRERWQRTETPMRGHNEPRTPGQAQRHRRTTVPPNSNQFSALQVRVAVTVVTALTGRFRFSGRGPARRAGDVLQPTATAFGAVGGRLFVFLPCSAVAGRDGRTGRCLKRRCRAPPGSNPETTTARIFGKVHSRPTLHASGGNGDQKERQVAFQIPRLQPQSPWAT